MPDDRIRLADEPQVAADIWIDAPPEEVFALVADINLPARFSTEFLGASWVEPASAAAVGACFTGRNSHPAAGEWETTSTVVVFEPPRLFEWAVGGMDGGPPGSSWRFTVTPEGKGSRLEQWMRIGPGRSFLHVAIASMPDKESRIINRRRSEHRASIEANLAGIKDLLEASQQ